MNDSTMLSTTANLTIRNLPTRLDKTIQLQNISACKPHCLKPKIYLLPVHLSQMAHKALPDNCSYKITTFIKNKTTIKSTLKKINTVTKLAEKLAH